jgi:uncharacterized membrane protein
METWAFAEGVSTPLLIASLVVVLAWTVWLVVELRKRPKGALIVLVTGLVAAAFVSLAVLRPARVRSRGSTLGPRVVVLVDQSRRMQLAAGKGTRAEVAHDAARRLSELWSDARISVFGFGEGTLAPLSLDGATAAARVLSEESDLGRSLSSLAAEPGERPRAVVVVSDGRVTNPPENADDAALGRLSGDLGVPIHAISVLEQAPPDASIREVSTAGNAVAHQPLALRVTVGCAGGLRCESLPVSVRELRLGEPAGELARGVAALKDGVATVEFTITLERAGPRVLEVVLDTPDGDQVKQNDRRILTFHVARERVRLLHVAGRPTYDVRQLRMWLKSDQSVDLVAFFILRTAGDDPNVDDNSELALIPFPVDELFTQHLPSFDAIVLQDIDAVEYQLSPYLTALEAYVRAGGGLIMVGGPSAFAGGGYSRSPLERVLPVSLPAQGEPYDLKQFSPRYTDAGRAAEVTRGVRELLGEELPPMHGSNSLLPRKEGAIVLWEHAGRAVPGGSMPVLALGEYGDGRSVALGVDGSHELAFSEVAERVGGRGYGALWDGLLGWLMRDPRFEAGGASLPAPCIAGHPARLVLARPPGSTEPIELSLSRLGESKQPVVTRSVTGAGSTASVELGSLEPGGYSARVRVGQAPPTRFDFACEPGGPGFRDSRPDAARLERIARASGGVAIEPDALERLPVPEATRITTERHTTPLAPAWVWTLCSAFALGLHWLFRRRQGLA